MKKQLAFAGFKNTKLSFGGSLLKGNPKTRRPLDSKWPILTTLRAKHGGMRDARVFGAIHRLVYLTAKKHGVRIYGFENVGNHLHLIIRIGRVHCWNSFIREFTSKIAKRMGSKSFWLYRPHTQIVKSWKKGFSRLKEYLYLNKLEAEGHIDRRETQTLSDLRSLFAALTGRERGIDS